MRCPKIIVVNAVVIIIGFVDQLFAIILDEAVTYQTKSKWFSICIVSKKGTIVEHFHGMVFQTLCLKMIIDKLFSKHGLNISRISWTMLPWI